MKLGLQVRQHVLHGRQLVCCADMLGSYLVEQLKSHVTGRDVVWLVRLSHAIARCIKAGVEVGQSNWPDYES